MNNDDQDLTKKVKQSIDKMEKARQEQKTILAQTVYLGSLSFLFIVPVIVGAYTGVWLDDHLKGFSFSWTLTLILLGIFVGCVNVYLFIKE